MSWFTVCCFGQWWKRVKMLNKRHFRSLYENYQKCKGHACSNFYNVLQDKAKQLCKPCRIKEKRENEKRI